MPAKKIYLEILTQEKQVYKGEVDIVLAPGYDGQIGILVNHVNMLTKLTGGELFIISGPSMTVLAITGGLLDVHNNQVTIMADNAVRADEIDIAVVEAAKRKAEEALREKLSDKEFAIASADLRRAVLELKVAKKRRYHYQTSL